MKKKQSIKIRAIEFNFNHIWGDNEKEGFIVKPIIISSLNQTPDIPLFEGPGHFITKKIRQKMHIDLTDFDININDCSSFFIGLDFIETVGNLSFEDFNITMETVSKKNNISFIKGNCANCDFKPFNLDSKEGLTLKYKLYYSVNK